MEHALELAEQFFKAATTGDSALMERVCAKDLVAIQNGAPPMGRAELVGFSMAVLKVVKDFHYENAIRSVTATGFVEEHDVMGTLPDGSKLKIAACVVGEVSGGEIICFREYLDSRAATGLIKALRPA